MTTQPNSLAILYDAGLERSGQPWEKLCWADPENYLQRHTPSAEDRAQALAVKYRTIIGQGKEGSMAVFPAPHQYFYPLDNAYNFGHTWYGTWYRDLVDDYRIRIRHELRGDRRW